MFVVLGGAGLVMLAGSVLAGSVLAGGVLARRDLA